MDDAFRKVADPVVLEPLASLDRPGWAEAFHPSDDEIARPTPAPANRHARRRYAALARAARTR